MSDYKRMELLSLPHSDLIERVLWIESMWKESVEKRDTLTATIAELEAEQMWIPVSTPPEQTGYYIIAWQSTWGKGELYTIQEYYKKEDGWGHVNVKFWRPLPQPPKDGE